MTPMTQDTQQAAKKEAETRTADFAIGIPGSAEGVRKVERNVPLDEPLQLAPNSELKVIGKRVPRYDGPLKASGAARYPSDIQLPGMLYGRLVSSAVPHAKIVSIDTSAAEKHPGVKAVHVLQNVLGQAELEDKSKEVPSRYPI